MGKNRGLPPVSLYRWDQYNTRWVKFTGSVDEKGLVQVTLSDGTNDAKIDESTATLVTMDHAHHEAHEGDHYYIEGHATLGNDPGVDDILRVKLVTPDTTKWAHFQWAISSSGILTATLHEGASGGMADGSDVTPLNNNRNSDNTSGLTITSNVTAADTAGALISNAKWGAAGFKSQIGGGTSRDDELMLKQNTTYLRTFTSSSASNIVQFKAAWYEHTNK